MGAGQGRGRPRAPRRGPLQPGRGPAGDDPAARPLPAADERAAAHRAGRGVARAGRAGLAPRRPEGRAGAAALPEDRGAGTDDRLPYAPVPLRAAGGRARRGGARGRGGADAQRRPRRGHQRGGDRRGRAPRGGVRDGRLPPDLGRPGSTTPRPPRSPAWRRTRRCGRSARPGSTTTARRRPRPTSAAPSRRRSRSPATMACRSSSTPATPRGRRPRPTRSSRSSTRGPPASPVILHCFLAPWRVDDAIERGWHCSFSGIVTYPQVRRPARGRREAARRAGPGRDRRALPRPAAGAGQAERARPRRRHRGGRRRGAGRRLRGAGADRRGERASRLRLVAAWSGSARTSSPTPTCSTRSSATPRSPRATSCSRSARGRGC